MTTDIIVLSVGEDILDFTIYGNAATTIIVTHQLSKGST